MYGDDIGDVEAHQILTHFKSIHKLTEQMNYVLTLLYSLDSKTAEKFRPEILWLEKVMGDLVFMRRVRHRDAMVEQYPAEYFGRDYGQDDPFLYDAEIESAIQDVSMRCLAVVGRVISTMKEDTVFLSDSM
jgi:hypothetical protein